MDLKKILDECYEKVGKNEGALQRFILASKKEYPDVTMTDVKKTANYLIEAVDGDFANEKEKQEAIKAEQLKVDQQWRNKVLNPVKECLVENLLENKKYDDIFGRGISEEDKALQQKILDRLPKNTRVRSTSKSQVINNIKDLI